MTDRIGGPPGGPKPRPIPSPEASSVELARHLKQVNERAAPNVAKTVWSDKYLEGTKKLVALTFDDGPEGDNKTGKVLDILKACNERHAGSYGPIRATFFVNGAKVKQHPELVRRIVAEGHVLGNHTWNHPHLPTLDKKAVQSQLETTQVAVDEALGYHYPLSMVRPPFGEKGGVVEEVLKERGDQLVVWSAAGKDWENKGKKAVLDNVFNQTAENGVYRAGGTVLLHDTKKDTIEALPEMLDRFVAEADRLRLVTVDELLEKKYPSKNR